MTASAHHGSLKKWGKVDAITVVVTEMTALNILRAHLKTQRDCAQDYFFIWQDAVREV